MSHPLRSAILFARGPAACAACHWVRRWLERRGIAVSERDISVSPAARDELLRLTNAELPVPTLLLPDGRVLIWPGPPTLEAIFLTS